MPEEPMREKYDLDRVVRLVISAGVAIGLFLLLRYLSDVLIPFAAAILLAYLLNPIVEALDRRIKRRAVSVLTTVFGLFVVLLTLLVILIPVLHAELTGITGILEEMAAGEPAEAYLGPFEPAHVEVVMIAPDPNGLAEGEAATSQPADPSEIEQSWRERYEEFKAAQAPWFRDMLERAETSLAQADLGTLAVEAARRLAPGVWGVVAGAINLLLGLMGLIIVVLYLVFILMDYPTLSSGWKDLLPPRHRAWVVEFLAEFTNAMRRYFRGQSLIAVSVGILFAIGFSLIGLRMAVLLGLFVGALNMVPYLQTVGMVPALALAVVRAIETESSLLGSVLLVLLVFGVVQLIQDALLTPKIMGQSTGLRPVAILLGVFIWGKLLGFLGVLLAIPLTCLGIAYYRRFVLGGERFDATALADDPGRAPSK